MPSASDGRSRLDGASLSTIPAVHPYTQDRPLLLPNGRKLRHLSAIVLRNLGTSSLLEGPRKSDEAVGTPREEVETRLEDGSESNEIATRRRRRRSTMTMTTVPGEAKRWEGVVGRRGDVYFTLHVAGIKEPVYISEVVPKAMNPDFQGFTLSLWGPPVMWRDKVTVKVWNNMGSTTGTFHLLLETDIKLAGLQYIGKTLETFRHPLPQNCVVFFLTDGCYTDFSDRTGMPATPRLNRKVSPMPSTNLRDPSFPMPSSTFDGLMRIITLEDCIYDATRTASDITSQLNSLLENKAEFILPAGKVSQKRERVKATHNALAIAKRRLESSRRKAEDIRSSIARRRSAIAVGRETKATGERYVEGAQELLPRCRSDLASTREALEAQRKRIVSDLSEVYPIEPVPEKGPLAFSIRGLYLPSTSLDDEDEARTAAALGYVVHTIYFLSFYFSVPLRYPVKFRGSTSFVIDQISVIQGVKTFPLWSKGTVPYRFEYGIFLVNKNIEQLMMARDMHCLDIRHTLPNLKNLLLYIAAGGSASHSVPPSIRKSIDFSRPPSRILSRSPLHTHHSNATSSTILHDKQQHDGEDNRSVTFTASSLASAPRISSPPPVSRLATKRAVPALTYAPPTPAATPSPPDARRLGTVGSAD